METVINAAQKTGTTQKILLRRSWAKFTCHQTFRLTESERTRCEQFYNRQNETGKKAQSKSAFIRDMIKIGLDTTEKHTV